MRHADSTWFAVRWLGIAAFGFAAAVGCARSQEAVGPVHDHDSSAGEHTGQLTRAAATPPGRAPEGMVWIPGGTFWMGCAGCDMRDALPVHEVVLDGFWMDAAPVTNEEFEQFVSATGYLSVAERKPSPQDYPDVPLERLIAGSAVFMSPPAAVPLGSPLQWWRYVEGANWRHPEGPSSNLEDRATHPVIHVAWEDAVAYAAWIRKRLPTEAEFEFAARGGLDRQLYPWGNELRPQGRHVANTWQGQFPVRNTREDGYASTSPVNAFPPNPFGLYDVGGNVWQWCSAWYRPDYYAVLTASGKPVRNPQGPGSSLDPEEPGAAKRVTRGGSFLCTDEYCSRYLVGSRGKSEVSSSGSNQGFRLVKSAN